MVSSSSGTPTAFYASSKVPTGSKRSLLGSNATVDGQGLVKLTGLPALGWHRSKRDDDQLPRLPLPIRGHPARRVAILTLHAEPPGCGGFAGRAGHHRLLRNH